MRILQVHNQYQHIGGEDTVVAMEADMLRFFKHDVYQLFVDNNDIQGLAQKIRTAFQVAYSEKGKKMMADAIEKFKPDIVHVHNFFPKLTPSIFDACVAFGVPVVVTLHNYRLICPGALLLRDGKICEKCILSSPYHAVRYGCYKGSRIGSLPVAYMVKNKYKWLAKVNAFIALTECAKNKFIESGLPEDKLFVKPNFASDDQMVMEKVARSGALFVGRLSSEKGLKTLLEAWQGLNVKLTIIGDGPFKKQVKLASTNNKCITFLGRKSSQEVKKEMKKAAYLVMPSEWYEGFPMVLVEALSQGLPVLCSNIGGMAEIVEDEVTGFHFEVGEVESLVNKVMWASVHQDEVAIMGLNARRVYEDKYTMLANYHQLKEIYENAIEQAS